MAGSSFFPGDFDEEEDANYIGFNIKTFTFDQVGVDGITYYYFVRE